MPVAALATVNTAADAAATSRATSNSCRFGASAHTASTSAPIMPAAPRFTKSFAMGRPQRAMGPGSWMGSGAAPPPYARPANDRDERDGEEHGGAEHADGAGHRTSLDAVARVPARSDRRGPRQPPLPRAVGRSPRRAADRRSRPETTKGRTADAARPFGSLGILLGGSLELRAGRDLDRVAGRDLDGRAGLRVAAGARCAVRALDGEPPRDGDLGAEPTDSASASKRPPSTASTVAWLCPVDAAIFATSSVLFSDLSAIECPPRTFRCFGTAICSCSGTIVQPPPWPIGPPRM